MSQSLLEAHLNSVLSVQSASKAGQKKNKQSNVTETSRKTTNKGKNYLEEARKEMSSKKRKVETIIKNIGEAGNTRRFSKRKLKSILKVHRSHS